MSYFRERPVCKTLQILSKAAQNCAKLCRTMKKLGSGAFDGAPSSPVERLTTPKHLSIEYLTAQKIRQRSA